MPWVTMSIIFATLVRMVVPVALLSAFQAWLCKKGKGWGLILPLGSVLIGLLLCLGVTVFAEQTGWLVFDTGHVHVSGDGDAMHGIQHVLGQILSLGQTLSVVMFILMFGVPAVIFFVILIRSIVRGKKAPELEQEKA